MIERRAESKTASQETCFLADRGASDESRSGIQASGKKYQTGAKGGRTREAGGMSDCRKDLQRAVLQVFFMYTGARMKAVVRLKTGVDVKSSLFPA